MRVSSGTLVALVFFVSLSVGCVLSYVASVIIIMRFGL